MKKFTVKDFIDYNAPCFSCNSPINIHMGVIPMERADNPKLVGNTIILKPVITSEYTEVDLKITYSDFLRLRIAHTTNQFSVNNLSSLERHLSSNVLFLLSKCDKCGTQVESENMEFDIERGFLKAFGLAVETIKMIDDKNHYVINSLFYQDKSNVVIVNSSRSASVFNMDFPLLPMYRFKNKEQLLNKLRTYLTFS